MSSAPKPEVRSSNLFDADAARRRCLGFRRRILAVSQQVQALHVAPAFSCMEITDAAYYGLIRRAQYVILEALGVLSSDDLAAYCTPGGRLGAHPDYGTPGIEASTGSLGHGMGLAVGMSYGDRLLGADRTVYAVFSDGEFQEGSTWEAMMMAANLKLDRLVAFLDLNDFQGLGRTSQSHPAFYPVLDKARAFGWEAVEVNGHDGLAIVEAVRGRKASDRPLLVVCRTVKGKGVSYMENVPIWHYRSPSPEEYRQALAELKEISG